MVFDGPWPILGQTNPSKIAMGEAGALVSQTWLPAVEKARAAWNVIFLAPRWIGFHPRNTNLIWALSTKTWWNLELVEKAAYSTTLEDLKQQICVWVKSPFRNQFPKDCGSVHGLVMDVDYARVTMVTTSRHWMRR